MLFSYGCIIYTVYTGVYLGDTTFSKTNTSNFILPSDVLCSDKQDISVVDEDWHWTGA